MKKKSSRTKRRRKERERESCYIIHTLFKKQVVFFLKRVETLNYKCTFFNGQKSRQFERAFPHTHTQTQRESRPIFTPPPSRMASSSSLRADQLRMKGLQLDDVSMKKLELDMREEVDFELQMQIFFIRE